ncbi:MAG: hypothetical protein U9R42_14615, partial [Bacteroidota bacterium]|nr:hypothetical protein [Bacteroidota bacterium]
VLKETLKSFSRFSSKRIQYVALGIVCGFCTSGMVMLLKKPLAVQEGVANWKRGFAGSVRMQKRFS